MSKVTPILPRDTRNCLAEYVRAFARGLVDRNSMLETVDKLMNEFKVKRIPLGSYELKHLGYVEGMPVIHIQGRLKLSDNCPACGSSGWRYISTEQELFHKDYDVITAFCLDCSCYYRKRGWKTELSEGKTI